MVTTVPDAAAASHRPAAFDMPWLQPALQLALRQAQSHAVLISLPPGAGAFELSLAIAQGWLCQSPQDHLPCGHCPSCHWIASRSHPDFLCLLPEALRESLGWQGDDQGEGDATGGSAAAASGEKSGKTRLSQDIRVDAVRGVVSFVQTTSSNGHCKVVLIHPAERMNSVAANALLKTLEEPVGVARFILSCSSPDALLPTVRSRCQTLPVSLPTAEQAAQWLGRQAIDQPDVLLAAAGGLPLEARDWAAAGLTAEAWLGLPRGVMNAQPGSLASWPVARWVDALQKLCHDAMCVAVQAPPRFFNAEVVPRGGSLKRLAVWGRQLQTLARHADHPWAQPLAVAALLEQARQALRAA